VSADGRFVAFRSISGNLHPDDGDSTQDVFVRDLQAGTTTLVSRASGASGTKGDGASFSPSISADGRHVAFATVAANLDRNDTDSEVDVFVRDLRAGTTTLVSRASGASGAKGDGGSLSPSLSADGAHVAFSSRARNLDPDDPDPVPDVFVRDLGAQTTTVASRASTADGAKGDSDSLYPSLSANGGMVAFDSGATNLHPDDTDGLRDVFVRDLDAGVTILASRASGASGEKGENTFFAPTAPEISDDGRFVTFSSEAPFLDPDDGDGLNDVYVRDVRAEVTILASRASGSPGLKGGRPSVSPSISGDGRFVTFESRSANLDPDDTDETGDVFVRDLESRVTTVVSRASGPSGPKANGLSSAAAISMDGDCVAFVSAATNLHPDDPDATPDVFLRELGSCPGVASAPPPPPAPSPTAPAPPGLLPGLETVFPAKIQVERARVERRARQLNVLAPITARASGEVEVEFFAAQQRFRFEEEVDAENRRIRFERRIPRDQADLGTGIMTITYPGDENTRSQEVRLRAASQPAKLELDRPVIQDGRIKAQGTINDDARGVVRLQLQYVVDGETKTLRLRGEVDDGEWSLDEELSQEVQQEIARRTGSVHSYTLFTGYFERRIRGEMQSFRVLGPR
jgi:Tol biopolymer transport system component